MAAVFSPITSDPIIPATAYDTAAGDGMTNGLVAPDGIVGVLPSYPCAAGDSGCIASGDTTVMYTEKELNYFIAGTTTNTSSTTFSASTTINFFPGSYIAQDLPSTISGTNPVTVYLGDTTLAGDTPPVDLVVPVTCTGWPSTEPRSRASPRIASPAAPCPAPSPAPRTAARRQVPSNRYIGAPGATTLSRHHAGAHRRGQRDHVAKHLSRTTRTSPSSGSPTPPTASTSRRTGLANGGVVSDCVTGSRPAAPSPSTRAGTQNTSGTYTGHQQPIGTTQNRPNLNQYAANEGTPGGAGRHRHRRASELDTDEMRWVGSAGQHHHQPGRQLRAVPLGRLGGRWRQRRLQPDLLLRVVRRGALVDSRCR